MEKEEIAAQIAKGIIDLRAVQDYAVGQIQALQVAFGTCLGALQSQPELLDQIQKALTGWQQLNLQHEASLPIRDGFESMRRALEAYMGVSPPSSVHTAATGKMN